MQTPEWVLWIAFWLHMLATVAWIGGLATLAVLVFPFARRNLEPRDYASFIGRMQKGMEPVGWLSAGVLTASGLVQMGANPNYEGFLAINNTWGQAMLLKHLVFLGMIGVSAYMTWGLTPQIRRAALLRARGGEVPEEETLNQRERRLLQLNLVLAVMVLLLTALARVA